MAVASRCQGGYVLLIVSVFLITLAVVSLTLMETTSNNRARVELQQSDELLNYVLEAGTNHARWQLAQNTTCTGFSSLATIPFGDHSYSAVVSPQSGSPLTVDVTATLSDGTARRYGDQVKTYEPSNTLVFQPIKDTFIEGESGHQDHNKGTDRHLKTNSQSDAEYRSLLEFDLSNISPGVKVISAEFEVYVESSTGTSDDVLIHRLTNDWVEDEVNWIERRSGFLTNWTSGGGDFSPTVMGSFTVDQVGWRSVDITKLVQQWVDYPSSNNGMILRSVTTGSDNEKRYASMDGSDPGLFPKLTIEFACECGTDCLAGELASGLTAYWAFDEASGTTADDSAGDLNGTLVGDSSWTNGIKDNALNFDGSGDRVDAGVLFPEGSPEITVAAWVYKRDSGDDRVITKSSGTAVADHIFSLGVYGTRIRVRLRTSDNGGTSNYDAGDIKLDQWTHLAFSYDGSILRIFQDGHLTAFYNVTGDMIASDLTTHIGNVNNADNRYWNGLLDDIRVYNRGLTVDEIAELAYVPYSCETDYVPDNKLAVYPAADASNDYDRGIVYFPPNALFGNTSAPSDGGWVAVGGSNVIFLLDRDGNEIATESLVGLSAFESITFVPTGAHSGKLIGIQGSSVFVIDPSTSPFTYEVVDLSSMSSSLKGVAFVSGGSQDTNLALLDSVGKRVLIVGQDWTALQSFSLPFTFGGVAGLAHVGGTDQFLLVDQAVDQVKSIDITGTLGASYDTGQFGYNNPRSVALDPRSCRHLLSDTAEDEYGVLNVKGTALYVEAYSTWSATQDNQWQSYDLTTFGVPPNSVVEILISNDDPGRERFGGVRSVGSTLDRTLELHEAEDGGADWYVIHAMTDSNGRIEHYSEQRDDTRFTLLGYWLQGTYQETWHQFAADDGSAWEDYPLNDEGVGQSQTAEVVIFNRSTGAQRLGGVRRDGDGAQRYVNLHEAESGGVDAATMMIEAGGDTDATVEIYAQNDSDIEFYVAGYWSVPPGDYVSTRTSGFDPSSPSATWTDWDLSSLGVPASAVVQIAMVNNSSSQETRLGVRATTSTLDRTIQLHEAESGGGDVVVVHVQADDSSTIQWYDESASQDHEFVILGWWVATP